MRRLFSSVIALVIVLSMTYTVSAYTGNIDDDDVLYPVEGGNIYFDRTTGMITGADASVTSADIPAKIDGVAVTGIGEHAFLNCSSMREVFIPDSVTHIEYGGFSGCSSLVTISLPDDMIKIGDYAFYSCNELSILALPSELEYIGKYAFSDCDSLRSIEIPGSVKCIDNYAFYECNELSNVLISDGVETIGDSAFSRCYELTYIAIPDSVTSIGADIFCVCNHLESIKLSNNLTSISPSAFFICDKLKNIFLPGGITTIGGWAFSSCDSLAEIVIPESVTSIDTAAFLDCNSLSDVFYEGNEKQWEQIKVGYNNNELENATIHYNVTYLYDAADPAEDMTLPTDALENVTNTMTATSAVNALTSGMTVAQKTSATGTDLATLFAETAVSKAASKEVTGNEIIINAAAVKELEATAASTAQAVETALVNGGVSTGRYIANTVTLTTEQTGKITIKVDPDILTTKVDKIRVETPNYALTLRVSDLEADLTNIVTISAESMDVGTSGSYALGGTGKAAAMNTMVVLDLPGGHTTNPVTLSFPSGSGKGEGEAVVNESGAASSSKYNPATVTMDGKVNTSGKYTVKSNEKDFTDIANKSAEMQNAIRYLASKGIINGTSETTFSPDGSISRAEIAALIVRALGKLDSTATANFTDVTTADWYYSAAASSQKNGIINGYSDNTFKGKNPIVKQEIVAVAARVLKNEMNYKEPANTQTYLAKYSDTVAGWAQPEVALATRENLIVYRVDGTFSGAKNMTRGDAAIIIYRLFQHIW